MAIEITTKREGPITKKITVPVPESALERYKKLQHELYLKNSSKSLHDFARERLFALMDEVEDALKKSS